jgi:DNA segregation ATPase FtsK/SpoIIIE, S-DNA-T family
MAAQAEAISGSETKRPTKEPKTPRKRRKTKKETPQRRESDREVSALRNEMLGIAITAASLALMLALISFYPEDVAENGLASSTGKTHNLIGPVGASLADILLSIMGLAAFLVPITLAIPGICFMSGQEMRIRTADAIGYPILLVCCAMAAHLWLDDKIVLGHDAGGFIGQHGAEILRSFLGSTGAYLVVYSLMAVTFVVTTGISLVNLIKETGTPVIDKIGEWLGQSWSWLKALPGRAWTDMKDIRSTRDARKAEEIEASTDGQAQSPKITNRRHRVETKKPVAEDAPDDANADEEQPPKKTSGGVLGLFRRRKNKKTENKETGDFILGEPEESSSSQFDVHDADEVGAKLDDTLDRVAVDGNGSDTLVGADAPKSAPPTPAVHEKPIVKRRRSKEAPVEQIEIPLPEDIRIEEYKIPPLHFLDYDNSDQAEVDPAFLQEQAGRLVEALRTFKIDGRVTEIHPGPVVTMYEFEPAPGVRISKIAGLSDDLAMALKAHKVRIVAPIPGKGVVGFEVPNDSREMVFLKEIIASKTFQQKKHALPMVLGKDIFGEPVVADLGKMPHLLVAGTTGSGKSVGVNGMITSLLYHASPEEVRFIMVDPKMLELSIYEGIPHLLLPVVTDPKKAAMSLKWACDEMDRRYELMKNAGVRDLKGFNRKVEKTLADAEAAALRAQADALLAQAEVTSPDGVNSPIHAPEVRPEPDPDLPQKLPYIVVVIDEFADLMMIAGKEVEFCVARIAQKARAAGIHLILATQRPSTDVITGVIKANFPTRIAFQVSSSIDSRTILGANGAENLLGKGDMLFMPPGSSKVTRVHGAFVSETEIHGIVEFIRAQQEPMYLDESVLRSPEEDKEHGDGDDADMDPMYEEAVRVVARDGRASTSHLQRRLSLGYNRAARIVDQMERDGLVGPSNGAKPRKVEKMVINQLVARWDGVPDEGPIDLV